MAMISPAFDSYQETLSTLKFASRAKKIRNRVTINQSLNSNQLIKKYEKEIVQLKLELRQRDDMLQGREL